MPVSWPDHSRTPDRSREAVTAEKEELAISTHLAQRQVVQRSADDLAAYYQRVRQFSERLCDSLQPEDCVIQSMPDVSPTRWHLAHTTWFFETFVLAAHDPQYQCHDPAYDHLFNSYYNTIGRPFPRPRRGLLSRPTVSQVWEYRRRVDDCVLARLSGNDAELSALARVITLGLHHEQQHQELMLTDIKHVFACNPMYPAYHHRAVVDEVPSNQARWLPYEENVATIGHDGEGFGFDNEFPRHRTLVPQREMASRLVTCGEYLQFIEDGGYRRPELWLSAGWDTVQKESWLAPLYWVPDGTSWSQFTLSGLQPLGLQEPVCHVSYFEADAFARWSDARLPTEAEWELAACEAPVQGNLADQQIFHPQPCPPTETGLPQQLFGDVWEWTSSPYTAYPGYRPPSGALGEYNGKFMCNQFVLRGGSCATSKDHLRPTYRNFFPPEARWQFSGIRLARDPNGDARP